MRKGDTADSVAILNALLLLLVISMDFHSHLHKLGLIFGAISVSLGQKATCYRAYLVLGLNPDFAYDVKLYNFRSFLALFALIWCHLFTLRSVWVLTTISLLVYEVLALIYHFGLSRLQGASSSGCLSLLRHTMPYDNSEAGNEEKFEHEAFEA